MEDFTLFLRELINRDIEKLEINLSKNLILEFNKTAENFLKKDMILEAIKVFALTKNIEQLNKIGYECIEDNKTAFAFKAFYFSKNKKGLNKTGEEFLKQGNTDNAFIAFKLADNKEMIEFLEKNFN